MQNSFISNIRSYLHHQLSKITYVCFALITLGAWDFCSLMPQVQKTHHEGSEDESFKGTGENGLRGEDTPHSKYIDYRKTDNSYPVAGGPKERMGLEYKNTEPKSESEQEPSMPTAKKLQQKMELGGDKLCIHPCSGEIYIHCLGNRNIDVEIKHITIKRADDPNGKDYIDVFKLRAHIHKQYNFSKKQVLTNSWLLDSEIVEPGAYAITIELDAQYTEADTRGQKTPITLTKTIEVENPDYRIVPTAQQLKERIERKGDIIYSYDGHIYIDYSGDVPVDGYIELTIKNITIKRAGNADDKDYTNDFNLRKRIKTTYHFFTGYTTHTLMYGMANAKKMEAGTYSITIEADIQYIKSCRGGEKTAMTLTKTIEVENLRHKDTNGTHQTTKIAPSDSIVQDCLRELEIAHIHKPTKRDIEKAYKNLCVKHHPDKVLQRTSNLSLKERLELERIATKKMKKLGNAKDKLLKIFTT